MAYVDTTMGLLVAVRTVDSHPVEILDQVALATTELMGSALLPKLDAAFHPAGAQREVQAALLRSPNVNHILLRGVRFPSHVLVVVTRASANLGMVFVRAREALAKAEASL